MNFILFDDNRTNLLPLSYTKPVSHLRVGILCIYEKWELFLSKKVSFSTENYLNEKYPIKLSKENYWINGSICPNQQLIDNILSLKQNQSLKKGHLLIAYRSNNEEDIPQETIEFESDCLQITRLWEIFQFNEQCIVSDFKLLTKGRISAPLSSTNQVVNSDLIFIEEGAKVEHSILNASSGPIYIGKGAEIMEGCLIRGPLAMCDHSVLKMGTKLYGATTLGPYCKVGGEVSNSVFMGYSNKGHDGFLGNSVIGEWCNLGADTNNSNLKNNYAEVKLWNYASERFENSGLQFCGLIMGDHSKCSINTMFNTGTVIGVSSNIFGSGFPRNFVPSFSWGGASGYTTFKPTKAYEVAEKMMQRRSVEFNSVEKNILDSVFELTKSYRKD
ncbi:MAG: GlmU family protein [Flavobacteriales bacterium]